jgi:hypothetical protein
MDIPEAPCVLDHSVITSWGSYWQWVVLRCPYCSRQHTHGAGKYPWDNPRKRLDVRVAPCRLDPAYTYQLVEVET